MSKSNDIAVLGAGSFGTALSICLAQNNQSVRLWGYEPKQIQAIRDTGRHDQFLPGISVPREIALYTDLSEAIFGVQDILIATPSQGFRALLENMKGNITSQHRIAWVTKGLEPKTGKFFDVVLKEVLPQVREIGVLSGPSFAKEVAKGLYTAVVLASDSSDFANALKNRFDSKTFEIFLSQDFTGTQISSVLKNVLAVATGILEGLGCGSNAQAAFIVKGIQELLKLGKALGAQTETLLGLAGLGDIILTCTDNQSRNRRFGYAIGCGKSTVEAEAEIGQVVETVHNVSELVKMADKYDIELPIVHKINDILFHQLAPSHLL